MMHLSRKTAVSWLLLVAAFVTVAVMTAAYLPGPWHDGNEGGPQDCQCPICKIVGQGILASDAVVHATPPVSGVFAVPQDPVFYAIEAIVHDHPARAPPA